MFYDDYEDFCSEEFDVEYFDYTADDSIWDQDGYFDDFNYDIEMFFED